MQWNPHCKKAARPQKAIKTLPRAMGRAGRAAERRCFARGALAYAGFFDRITHARDPVDRGPGKNADRQMRSSQYIHGIRHAVVQH